ncbi:sensor histidine kinase [Streptomyces luteireticuli]|uniref:sensor histidine kinase n=1 Tax=Streptomyces luteireticuli TaxID=173858 RepID=UPI003558FB42
MTPPPTPPPYPEPAMPPPPSRTLPAALRDLFTPAGPPVPLLGQAERPFVRRLPYLVALALVALFLPVTATILPTQYGVQSDLALVLAVAQSAPLLIAVRRPLLAWAIAFPADVVGALVMSSDFGGPAANVWPWPAPQIIGLLVLMLLVGLRERPRTLAAVWVLVSAAGWALTSAQPGRSNGSWLVVVILGGLLMALGGALRRSSTDRRALAEQETISEAERARRTLLEERTRIARELHDVVAHHMSVITVQADSAPYRIPDLPPAAAEEFGTIAATARESLAEMRRLLGVLRSEDAGEGGGEKAPQPGVGRIGQLVEATVRAGQPVELTLGQELPSAPLPQAVDLSAYRIVQEALANVVRHAPGALARVSVTADDEGLTVLVVNDPADGPHTPLETSGTGHGLVGMRERVRLVGGTLDTGPLPGGGFRVAARLPFVPTHLENPAA